jgi:hypothetical protein
MMPTLSTQVDVGLNLLHCAFPSETNKLFSTKFGKMPPFAHLLTGLVSMRQVNMTQQDSGIG